MNIRELRQALTCIDNQEMTVRELRQKLFEADDQDAVKRIKMYHNHEEE